MKKKKAAVFVCSRAYLRNYTSDLRANFCARYRRRHCFQITGHMLLRRHAHANTPAASYFGCVVSWTTAGAETRRVHRASGVMGGACNEPLRCYH